MSTQAKYVNPNQQTGGNAALAHTIHGAPVGDKSPTNGNSDTSKRQVQSVFRRYQPPKRRHRDNPEKLLCSEPDCKAYPMADSDYCIGHARSKGLLKGPKCGHTDCKASPMKDSDHGFCFMHARSRGLVNVDSD